MPAFVGLDHDVDCFDTFKPLGVAIFSPARRARQSDCRYAMVPQGMDVGLALNQHHMSRSSGIPNAVQTIQARLAAGLPAEAVAGQGDTEADG
jgi:hypothetical protein